MDDFWDLIGLQLDSIEAAKPTTAAGVIELLGERDIGGGVRGGFFAGSGGDRSLWSALRIAGWEILWMQAGYYYAARHPESLSTLTYIEGDVLAGNHIPLPHEVAS